MSKINEERNKILHEIRELEIRVGNPTAYHLTMMDIPKIEKRMKELTFTLNTMPLQEQPSYKFRMTTVPLTIRSTDGELELSFIKDKWIVSKFAHDFTGGRYSTPIIVLNDEGVPIALKYEFTSSETGGRPLTMIHEITIDEPLPKPKPRVPMKPVEVPMWNCSCGIANYVERKTCTNCGRPRDRETAKELGLAVEEPEKKDGKLSRLKDMFSSEKKK